MTEQWKYVYMKVKMMKSKCPTLPVYSSYKLFPAVSGYGRLEDLIGYYNTVHMHCCSINANSTTNSFITSYVFIYYSRCT